MRVLFGIWMFIIFTILERFIIVIPKMVMLCIYAVAILLIFIGLFFGNAKGRMNVFFRAGAITYLVVAVGEQLFTRMPSALLLLIYIVALILMLVGTFVFMVNIT